MPTQLERLAARCKGEVIVSINPHRGSYQSVGEYMRSDWVRDVEINAHVAFEMVKRNTMVSVQFYPATPVGFFVVHHFDLEAALSEAHSILDSERVKRKKLPPLAWRKFNDPATMGTWPRESPPDNR